MKKLIFSAFLVLMAFAVTDLQAQSQQVQVTITNNAPQGGIALTPLWAGFHNGSFDSYNGGQAVQQGIESIAEDGDASLLSSDFLGGYTYIDNGANARILTSQTSGRVDGVLGTSSGPILAGQTVSQTFSIDASENQYFSYASMILPSNDFLVFNGNPFAHDLSSLFGGGGPISFDIGLPGTVNDVGTELNDFATSAGNALFNIADGQTGPNQGPDEFGVVTNVTDVNPFADFGNAGSLTRDQLSLFNFNDSASDRYPNGVATITITAVPEPTSVGELTLGFLGLLRRRRG